jgi:hypothetical protein
MHGSMYVWINVCVGQCMCGSMYVLCESMYVRINVFAVCMNVCVDQCMYG